MKIMVAGLITLVITGFLVIWFGLYNVAANDKHYALTLKVLELVRNRSITMRADETNMPDIEDEKLIAEGALNYADMCTGCHLAPGMKATELHTGLYPQPPNFSQSTHGHHNPANMFWVIKNGIKMTGMPAWSPAHTDNQIWSMVAFINKMNEMSAEQYQQLIERPTPDIGHDDGHSHSH